MSIRRYSNPLNARQIAELFWEPQGVDRTIDLFSALGSDDGLIHLEPEPDIVSCPDTRELLVWYLSLRATGQPMPPWSAFSPDCFKSLLGSLHVISALPDQQGLFYEIFGTSVAARYGSDLTKTGLPPTGNLLAVVFHGVFQAAIIGQQVIYTLHRPPEGSTIKDCQRLILPFADDTGEFHRLVVAHRPANPSRGRVGGVI